MHRDMRTKRYRRKLGLSISVTIANEANILLQVVVKVVTHVSLEP